MWVWVRAKNKPLTPADPDALVPTSAQIRREQRHQNNLTYLLRIDFHRITRNVLRAADRQVALRRDERPLRLRALAHLRWARWRGWSQTRCAAVLWTTAAALVNALIEGGSIGRIPPNRDASPAGS